MNRWTVLVAPHRFVPPHLKAVECTGCGAHFGVRPDAPPLLAILELIGRGHGPPCRTGWP